MLINLMLVLKISEQNLVTSDYKFVFSIWEIYCPMGWENLLGYMFSSLFLQLKVAKGETFTTALQKDKSNPVLSGEEL